MYSREEEERCVYLGAGAMERMDDVAEEWRGATKNVCCCCEAAAVFVFVLYRCVFSDVSYRMCIECFKYGILRGPGRRLRCNLYKVDVPNSVTFLIRIPNM